MAGLLPTTPSVVTTPDLPQGINTSDLSDKDLANHYFLGLDLGTQSLKGIVCRASDLSICSRVSVNYDLELSKYGSSGGVLRDTGNPTVIYSPTSMFLDALDILFQKLSKEHGDVLRNLIGISGCAQQHGSVYWTSDLVSALGKLRDSVLDQGADLCHILSPALACADSPIWMDSSTRSQCDDLEKAIGGRDAMASTTGSIAYERFTASQILKKRSEHTSTQGDTPTVYDASACIQLLSSFIPSVLTGQIVRIDAGDASGMNLMDLVSCAWADKLTSLLPDIATKLGRAIPSNTVCGRVADYFVQRYQVRTDALVVAFTGDNLSALAGMALSSPEDIGVSLGTSTTLFGAVARPIPQSTGHIFRNPVHPTLCVGLLCVKNGGRTRDDICQRCCNGDWDDFTRILNDTPPGNEGVIGLYYNDQEITPPAPAGVYIFDQSGARITSADVTPSQEVRCVVESQALNLYLHSQALQFKPKRIIITGGGAISNSILQVYADVFGTSVEKAPADDDAAALGGAYRAYWSIDSRARGQDFGEALKRAKSTSRPGNETGGDRGRDVIYPRPSATQTYREMLAAFEARERVAYESGL